MLTISKPLSAGQAQTYHQKEFTAKEQNYWSQQGVIAGEWQGRLADAIWPCWDRLSRRLRETQPGPASTDRRPACAAASVL